MSVLALEREFSEVGSFADPCCKSGAGVVQACAANPLRGILLAAAAAAAVAVAVAVLGTLHSDSRALTADAAAHLQA